MKGDLHVRFWNSGRKSDLPADCNSGSTGKRYAGQRSTGTSILSKERYAQCRTPQQS
jgi:hypothetical protein